MPGTIRHSVGVTTGAIRACVNLLRDAVALLAAAPDPAPADNELNSSISGGVLNYRTGKLDDGTDPYGWYERD